MDKYISKHVDRLYLDPNNYRFIDSKDYVFVEDNQAIDSRIQQRTTNLLSGKNNDLISDLIVSFKANGILKLDPIQVKELDDGIFLVIEGNRRATALKYLYKQFKEGNDVGKLNSESFKSIEIVRISDENPVQHLITMGLHHISGKRKWSPLNQAQLISDLIKKHGLTEKEVCDSLSITKHNFRRNIRILSLINTYKESDFGDQFQGNMFSIFEEIIKKVEMKNWLQWNDQTFSSDNKLNEEKLFSWISVIEENEDDEQGETQLIRKEAIITKSHEIRELSKFINDPKAVEKMEESRSITAGFALSDSVGESRLQNAMDNIGKEVNTAFQFSEYLKDDDYSKIFVLRDKLDRLIPSSNGIIINTNIDAGVFFKEIKLQYTSLLIHQYRKLRNVEIKNLSKVNLFVGDNNSGKTSVLEAFYILSRQNHLPSFIALEKYRGRFLQEFQTKWLDKLVTEDIKIEGVFNQIETHLSIRKLETDEHIDKSHYLNTIVAESTIGGDELQSAIHLFDNKQPELYFQKSQFLCSANFSSPYRFDGILLQKAHARAIEEKYFDELVDFIRQKMDSSIEKIELINMGNDSRFMVSSSNNATALDLTKYGEGLQRVFEIALLIGYSRNGILCIDELDSAIHKDLLIDFTAFIQEAAERFNVQLFLSTHSKECIDAFVKNNYPDDDLRAYSLKEDNEIITCKYLEGNKLRQLVESINIDIR